MEKGWLGLPYYTIAEHYKKIFGEKVYKIPVTVADNCPNRMGLKGMQTCVFCDEWGSAANADAATMELREQIELYHSRISAKYKARSFLAYFQAYTNTFLKVQTLRESFDTAISYDYIKGLTVGTRPDCLSPAVMDLWEEYHEKSFVFVELGLQSFKEEDLIFMRRGHTAADSVRAIHKIAKRTHVDLGVHLIFGSPNETVADAKEAALRCNDLPITNIKLHNLHVLKGTPLEEMYHAGKFMPIEFEDYAAKVEAFLAHLSPRIAVHRLAAYSSRWDELVAPEWTRDKMGTHQKIINNLRTKQCYQGRDLELKWNPNKDLQSHFGQMILHQEETLPPRPLNRSQRGKTFQS